MSEVMEVPEQVKEKVTKVIRSTHEKLGQVNKKGQTYTDAVSYTHLTLPTNREV